MTDKYSTYTLFLDPVSFAKTSKSSQSIGRFHTVKPNRLETELISGSSDQDDKSMLDAAQKIFEMGCKQIFITLGEGWGFLL